jgi:chemotaxis signal transduction protein
MLAAASTSASVRPHAQAVLLVMLGAARYALPLTEVERVLPMASVLRVPDQPGGMLGVLNLHGEVLPVVDPRARLGLPRPACAPDQRLIVLTAGGRRFLLWVDAVEDIAEHAPEALSAFGSAQADKLTTHVLRRPGELVPVLSPSALREC